MDYDPKSRHYDIGGLETIEIIKAKLTSDEFRGYLKGNILKYACRLGHKGDAHRDAEKLCYYAKWLLDVIPGKKSYTEPADQKKY